jgi:hypothetical protein
MLAAVASAQSLPRLSWFNPRERLVSIESDQPVQVSLHTPEGKWLENLHPGVLQDTKVFQIPSTIPPGLYIVRIRAAGGEKLERVMVF